MSLHFFKLLVQLSCIQNQFVRFAPQPFRPTLPYYCSGEILSLSHFAIWQRLLLIPRCHYISLSVVCFLHALMSRVWNYVLENHRYLSLFCDFYSIFVSQGSFSVLSYVIYYLFISCHWLIAVHSGTTLPCPVTHSICMISVVK